MLTRVLGVIAKEEINPAVPDKKRLLVLLDKGGQNWYLRLRQHGRYRFISLGTPDLYEARKMAFFNPPEPNPKQALSIRKALLEFQESRQQLMDAPGVSKSIRLNTFKTYKARVVSVLSFFEEQRIFKKETKLRTVASLTAGDFSGYEDWRKKEGIMMTTIKTEITQINAILSWFHTHEYINKPIKIPLPVFDIDKYRLPNRLLEEKEEKILWQTLKSLCSCGDPDRDQRWQLYAYWLRWLQDTFTRPHESRLLCFSDVK